MAVERPVQVHLLPALAPAGSLAGGLAVVIDVLRATTVIVHALAAGCRAVVPCAEIDEAKARAAELRIGGRCCCLASDRGTPVPDSTSAIRPSEFTAKMCKDATVVMTTTNGTRALLRAIEAERVLIAAFVNFSAVCEQIGSTCVRSISFAGTDGMVSLEDTLLAGAIVDVLCESGEVKLNDAARLAWDGFENHGQCLLGALEVGRGGEHLRSLGYDSDIRAAADVDRFAIVPELRRDPVRSNAGPWG